MPVAVVTGGNRGLGLETCRQLGRRGYRAVLASRGEAEGRRAAGELARVGAKADPWPLDVADPASIAAFASRAAEERLSVDALVNNAGVYHERLDARAARESVAVNFLGPLRLTEALSPRLATGARVVMVSSAMGELSSLPEGLRKRLEATRGRGALVRLLTGFAGEVERGEHPEAYALAYRVSKAGLNALTRLLAAELRPRGVLVNAVCPGWVRTRMGGAGATRELGEGAAGIVWAATLPPDGPGGGFFRDGQPIPW
ncbi:MAG TPA: SDR family NAD(P)-dependent oxidoreductase [Anaeromyxobacteraceae bacterium]|nr:SDR family NAD(P)-dependent oxidoreductase [Anaeromyxobacteraceae bacterium]